jgi:hypothetical protein
VWHDVDGTNYNCSWYAEDDHCEMYGLQYEFNGTTAKRACCACGGGTNFGNINVTFEDLSRKYPIDVIPNSPLYFNASLTNHSFNTSFNRGNKTTYQNIHLESNLNVTSIIKVTKISGNDILCLIEQIDVTNVKQVKYSLKTPSKCSVEIKMRILQMELETSLIAASESIANVNASRASGTNTAVIAMTAITNVIEPGMEVRKGNIILGYVESVEVGTSVTLTSNLLASVLEYDSIAFTRIYTFDVEMKLLKTRAEKNAAFTFQGNYHAVSVTMWESKKIF